MKHWNGGALLWAGLVLGNSVFVCSSQNAGVYVSLDWTVTQILQGRDF